MSIPFQKLSNSDLIIDEVYEWGHQKNLSAEPICKLLPVGNAGGFRKCVSKQTKKLQLLVLYSDGFHPDWPDGIDQTTGIFTYFGDNRTPGPIDSKPGNRVLETMFNNLHSDDRIAIPPVFIFEKSTRQKGVQFLGIAVPGGKNIPMTEDLSATWRISNQKRFQNYKSLFTILDINVVKRDWIRDIISGNIYNSRHCPPVWKKWIQSGTYKPLLVKTVKKIIRKKEQQLPDSSDKEGWEMIKAIHNHFPTKNDSYRFEELAKDIFINIDSNVQTLIVTRPSVDGGRDALGEYQIGTSNNGIIFEFNLEAKCYKPGRFSVGVKGTSRLISRIRHRMFGVLVTTSFLANQAYKEIIEDQHPIIIITAVDIINTLRKKMNINTMDKLTIWLQKY